MENHKVIWLFWEIPKKGRPRIEYALTLDKVFSTWIRDRIAQYDFVENQDFVWVSEFSETQRAVRICGKTKTLFGFPKIVEPKERYEFVEKQRLYLVPQKKWSEWLVVRICWKTETLFAFPKIRKRKERYAFVENQDYVRFTENSVKPQGGRPSIGYFISLDKTSLLGLETVLGNMAL